MKCTFQFQFNGGFTPKQCELMWKNLLHPSINRGRWTAFEDGMLKKLASNTKGRLWDSIAEELSKARGPGTKEELVCETKKRTGESRTRGLPFLNHSYLCPCLPGLQCFVRYKQKFDKALNNRKWTKSEDEKLLNLVETCRLRGHVPWRKVSACATIWI